MYSKENLSDRFIPLNKGIDLLNKFNLTNIDNQYNESIDIENSSNSDEDSPDEKNDNNFSYNKMLKFNFLKRYNSLNYLSNLSSNNNNSIIKNNYFETYSSLNNIKLFSYQEPKKQNLNNNFIYDLKNIQRENEQKSINDNKIFNEINPLDEITYTPYKEILFENILDNYYLNLLDWSSKNIVAISNNDILYLHNANENNNNTQKEILFKYEQNNNNIFNNKKYISSLTFSENGDILGVGNSYGQLELYDINTRQLICSFKGHSDRIGSISWTGNIISTGSKDSSIITRDIRCRNNDENIIYKFFGHSMEVCGLKWSFDGSKLASGGNDNKLMIWNLHSNKPLLINNEHTSAVKAIAWSSRNQNIFATGGGVGDNALRIFNASNFENILSVDSGAQVCNLIFSKSSDEMISTHGYDKNNIILWKLPNMEITTTLSGHDKKVLYLGLSPDGKNIVTGAGDNKIKFWRVFPKYKKNNNSLLSESNMNFR